MLRKITNTLDYFRMTLLEVIYRCILLEMFEIIFPYGSMFMMSTKTNKRPRDLDVLPGHLSDRNNLGLYLTASKVAIKQLCS